MRSPQFPDSTGTAYLTGALRSMKFASEPQTTSAGPNVQAAEHGEPADCSAEGSAEPILAPVPRRLPPQARGDTRPADRFNGLNTAALRTPHRGHAFVLESPWP